MRLALLDRDGTLNRKAPDGEYVVDPGTLEALPRAAEVVRRLNVEAGRRFGARTVQLTAGPSAADRTAPDLLAAVTRELGS